MGVYFEGSEHSSFLRAKESSGKGDTNFTMFANLSYLKLKEESQKGDLKFGQNSEISKEKLEMSGGSQNSQNCNIVSSSEDLFSEGKKDHENKFDLVNYFGYKKESFDNSKEKKIILYKKIDVLYNIKKKSTIILIINYNKENESKFEKIIHEEGEITYDQFSILYKEGHEQFELDQYNILFEIFYKKLNEFLKKIKNIANQLFSEIKLGNELPIKINLKEYNKNLDANNNNIYIKSEYIFIDKSNKIQNQDENILNGGDYPGFSLFSNEIINYISNQTNNNNNNKNNNNNNNNNKSTKDASKDPKPIKNSFINFKKVIGQHKGKAHKIMESNDGSYISGGDDGIIQYKIKFSQIVKKQSINYYSFFIDKNEVIISLKDQFTSLSKFDTSISDIEGMCPCNNLFELEIDNYLICNNKGIYYASNIFIFASDCKKLSKLYDKAYKGGIKITDNIIAITSNCYLPNGENKLVFFNSKSQKFLKEFEIEKYSYTLSENNCSIMKIQNHEDIKLLLVACKKYNEGDNGILLIKLKFKNDDIEKKLEKKYQNFYDTGNFEVYCFCQIFENDDNYVLNNVQKNEFRYFLVGGFDIDISEGLIKLYKVIYCDENEKIEIEFIQNIIIDKKEGKNDLECFKGFKEPISCIIQSPQGEILVTCYDGNVYLFSELCFEKIRENKDKNILES